jgi:hypothetical protein
MLPTKSTKFFSELNDFLSSGEKGILKIMDIYKKLDLHKIKIGYHDLPQASYRRSDLLLCLMMFPVFQVKNVYSYLDSTLNEFFEARKNTLYRLKNDSMVNWRHIVNLVNNRLFKTVATKADTLPDGPRCLILDDTDFVKTSYRTEHVGFIWSHVAHRTVLGFKGLFLGYWDSKSFFALDFSLHKERGKNQKKPFGLNPKQRSRQYSMPRDNGTPGRDREKELVQDKISMAIKMVAKAISRKMQVDYVLMDSWFFCNAFVQFIKTLSPKVHILAIAKMGKTHYRFEGNEYTPKQLSEIMKNRKKVKRVKALNLYCADVLVDFKGTPLKLFFCKNSKRGKWHVLATTNTKLGIIKAYQTYSIRWTVEVFFKEGKQHFGLGKSQSQDFNGQIADISIAMMVYNVFSLVKRFESYETLGCLFRETGQQTLELTVYMRIWQFILELLQIIAEIVDGDFNELIVSNMKNEPENNRLLKLFDNQLYQQIRA